MAAKTVMLCLAILCSHLIISYAGEEGSSECNGYNECHQVTVCNGTLGSYECGCLTGYQLQEDNKTCEAIIECLPLIEEPFLCANNSGDIVYSCIKGYNYTNGNYSNGNYSTGNCTDIDECLLYEPCDTNCTNSVGSFTCSCNEGFGLGSDNLTCQDIDECTGDNECQQMCINTLGSYECTCMPGYTLNEDGKNCDDYDECSGYVCHQMCNNTLGSYNCSCLPGYELKEDGVNCVAINECSPPAVTPLLCANYSGMTVYSCIKGYNYSNGNCTDVNECLEFQLVKDNLCPSHQICENTVGGYECVASPTFKTDPPTAIPTDTNSTITTNSTETPTVSTDSPSASTGLIVGVVVGVIVVVGIVVAAIIVTVIIIKMKPKKGSTKITPTSK